MSTNFHNEYFYQNFYGALTGLVTGVTRLNLDDSKIQIYAGTQPASVHQSATSAGGVLLGTVNFSDSTFTAPVDAVVRLNIPLTITPSVDGTAAWARVYCYNHYWGTVPIFDTDVSLTGSNGGVILSTLNIVNGQAFTVDQISLFIPEEHGTIKLSLAFRNALLESLREGNMAEAAIGEVSTLSIYSGTQPASVYDAPSGTKLADFTSNSTSVEMWQSPDATGTAVRSTEASWNQATALTDGAPGYFRLVKNDFVMQGTCSTTGANVNVDKASVVTGETLTITEMSLLAA